MSEALTGLGSCPRRFARKGYRVETPRVLTVGRGSRFSVVFWYIVEFGEVYDVYLVAIRVVLDRVFVAADLEGFLEYGVTGRFQVLGE